MAALHAAAGYCAARGSGMSGAPPPGLAVAAGPPAVFTDLQKEGQEVFGWQASQCQTDISRRGLSRLGRKKRYCATYPNVGKCRHGKSCYFAHSREELAVPILSPMEETCSPLVLSDDFFTQRFKTLWCPIGGEHDWSECPYAHTYQDARRPPSLGYGDKLCPYWSKKETNLPYGQRCPNGERCPYAHGAKEQLYHPNYFRTLVCRDLQRRKCPRGNVCAFYHKPTDRRIANRQDGVDYNTQLPAEVIPPLWAKYFLNPPRFQEAVEGVCASWEVASPTKKNKESFEDPISPRTASTMLESDSSDIAESFPAYDRPTESMRYIAPVAAARSRNEPPLAMAPPAPAPPAMQLPDAPMYINLEALSGGGRGLGLGIGGGGGLGGGGAAAPAISLYDATAAPYPSSFCLPPKEMPAHPQQARRHPPGPNRSRRMKPGP